MTPRFRLRLALCTLCLAAPLTLSPASRAVAAPSTEALARLASQSLDGDFREERQIPGFPKPMVSKGRFSVRPEGIVWTTSAPFSSRVCIDATGIRFESEGNERAIAAAETPAIGRVADVLRAVLSGRIEALEPLFHLDISETDGRLLISARPKAGELAAVVAEVRILGRDRVEEVEMRAPSGETTRMIFTNVVRRD